MKNYSLDYLKLMEAESIHIIREVYSEFKNPVLLYSIGKDSSVLLHLCRKAFYPANIPFHLMHIDTGFKFNEMIKFREYIADKFKLNIIVLKNEEPAAQALRPDEAHTDHYIYLKKTKPLLEGIKQNKFDAAIGGGRREEEKSRAKERVFSVRDEHGVWDPKNQRPEIWNLYNSKIHEDFSVRVFPLSNWTEIDIWNYIKRENIEVVQLYFSQKRKVIRRLGVYLRLDEFVQPKENEEVLDIDCRYRTLGCSPSTGAVPSTAKNVDEILIELMNSKDSERVTRAIDHGSESAMENKKKEGYF
jgi:sulfate adenylyltransferase subunit 2